MILRIPSRIFMNVIFYNSVTALRARSTKLRDSPAHSDNTRVYCPFNPSRLRASFTRDFKKLVTSSITKFILSFALVLIRHIRIVEPIRFFLKILRYLVCVEGIPFSDLLNLLSCLIKTLRSGRIFGHGRTETIKSWLEFYYSRVADCKSSK